MALPLLAFLVSLGSKALAVSDDQADLKPKLDTPAPISIKSQTKMEKVKEWTGDLMHPVAVATKPARFTVKKVYGSFHKRVMSPTNAWAERHSGLINLGSACGSFGINAILGAKKLGN